MNQSFRHRTQPCATPAAIDEFGNQVDKIVKIARSPNDVFVRCSEEQVPWVTMTPAEDRHHWGHVEDESFIWSDSLDRMLHSLDNPDLEQIDQCSPGIHNPVNEPCGVYAFAPWPHASIAGYAWSAMSLTHGYRDDLPVGTCATPPLADPETLARNAAPHILDHCLSEVLYDSLLCGVRQGTEDLVECSGGGLQLIDHYIDEDPNNIDYNGQPHHKHEDMTCSCVEDPQQATCGLTNGFAGFIGCMRGLLDDLILINWPALPNDPWCLTCPPFRRLDTLVNPVAIVDARAPIWLPLFTPDLGRRYRMSVRVSPSAMPATVSLVMGGTTLASHTLSGPTIPETGSPLALSSTHGLGSHSVALSGSFIATPATLLGAELVVDGADAAGILDVSLVRDDEVRDFDSIAARESAIRLSLANLAGAAKSMPFVDGTVGKEAKVSPGERMVVTDDALVAGTSWDLTMSARNAPASGLRCGLVFENGTEASQPCGAVSGVLAARLTSSATQLPLGYFIDNPTSGTAYLHDPKIREGRESCAKLGDSTWWWTVDQDYFEFEARAGESVTVRLRTSSGASAAQNAAVTWTGPGNLLRTALGSLPRTITATVPASGRFSVLVAGTASNSFKGDYCLEVTTANGEVPVDRGIGHE